jgi:hypothetical protein
VSRLIDNAQRILDTAELGGATAITILMRAGRPIEINSSNDWCLDALLLEKRADEAFRVTRRGGELKVEGRSRQQTCVLTRRCQAPWPLLPLAA